MDQSNQPFNSKSSEVLARIIRGVNLSDGVQADPAAVRQALELLCEPGAVYELRALGTDKGTIRGYFKDFDALAIAAVGCTNKIVRYAKGGARAGFEATGVYITANPVVPELWAWSADEIQLYVPREQSTEDKHIVKRRWLLIDLDYQRPTGISATDAEHEAALEKAREIRAYLKSRGLSSMLADSGNGGHVLCRIDLPNDEASKVLLQRVLKTLNRAFGTDQIIVDEANFNAARIWKLYGTVARKGSDVPDRPHRVARILEVPDELEIVSLEQLEELTTLFPEDPPNGSGPSKGRQQAAASPGSSPAPASGELSAATVAAALGNARKVGDEWVATCVLASEHTNGDSDPSLYLKDGSNGVVVICRSRHAHEQDRVIEALKARGLWPGSIWGEAIKFKDVPIEPVEWLWQDRIAIGKENLLVGDPDNGKSWLSLEIAAHVTTGTPFADGTPCQQGNVVIIGLEDAVSDTMRPRLEAQGGDSEHMYLLTIKARDGKKIVDQSFSIADHLPQLRQKILDIGNVRLVIIDPLTAHLGDVDANKDAAVRAILTPLAALERYPNR
jgi:hypothetical protein